jgi:catechol 2,3-dioxygenase-like lactoylglutathione lyase family enzyme
MNMTGASDQPIVANQTIGQVALVVRDYNEAIDFYVGVLGFTRVEDTYIAGQDKRLGRGGTAGLNRVTPASRASGEQ